MCPSRVNSSNCNSLTQSSYIWWTGSNFFPEADRHTAKRTIMYRRPRFELRSSKEPRTRPVSTGPDEMLLKMQLVRAVRKAPFRQISTPHWRRWWGRESTITSTAASRAGNEEELTPHEQQPALLYIGGRSFLYKSNRKLESKEINDRILHTMKLAKTNKLSFIFRTKLLVKQNSNFRLRHTNPIQQDFICCIYGVNEINM
jgi:hypothetical protein